MATTRLTGRTLALATVALVLACAKAVLGQPEKPERMVPTPSKSTINPGPAVRGANVSTFTQSVGGGGGSRVTTFTSGRGGGSSNILTVQGDHRSPIKAGSGPSSSPRNAPMTALKPGGTPKNDSSILVRRIVIDMSKPGLGLPAVREMPAPAADARLAEAISAGATPPSLGRNAFSLGAGAPLVGISPQ